jgi:hypothetical protein
MTAFLSDERAEEQVEPDQIRIRICHEPVGLQLPKGYASLLILRIAEVNLFLVFPQKLGYT